MAGRRFRPKEKGRTARRSIPSRPRKYDGKEVAVTGTGLTWDTSAIKQADANTLTEERSKKGGKYHSSVRSVVSKDGKTMTSTTKGTGTDGKPFTSVAVFGKQ